MRSLNPSASARPNYTVLIVESPSTERNLYRHSLLADTSCHYTLIETDSAASALRLYQHQEIHGILADAALPDSSGLEFIQTLRTQFDREPPPIVIVTSERDPTIAVRAMKLGAEDYLFKQTLTPEQLQTAIRDAIENTSLRLQLQHQKQRFRELELKQRIEELQQQQYRLQRLIDTAPIGIGIGTASGEVKVINGEMLRLHGYTRQEFEQQGMNWRNFTPPELSEDVDRAMEQLQRERIIPPAEKDLVRRDGSKMPVWISAMQWLDGTDEHVAFAVDLTLQKQAEAEREQLLAQAEAANRSKDEFVSVVAHELRSPLNAIMGWATLLKMRAFDAETTSKALETIVRNTQAQEQLIEDLLDVSRMVHGTLKLEFASVNLRDVLMQAIDTVRLAAEAKALQLEIQIQEIAPIRGDARRLQQVVLNLLTNAIKFTPDRGRIHIQLDQHNSQLRIQISDTGKGINPDFLPHIFERFQQDKQNATTKQGLGLGLAIVQYVVEQHGGTIIAQSDGEGQGATFTVLLPLLQWHEEVQVKNPLVLADSSFESLSDVRVLLVDDNFDLLNLTSLILEQAGAVVQTAMSAAVALEQLPQFQPHVLVSDIAMPEQDGYELLKKVRMIQPEGQIPAIALTARVSYSCRDDIQRAGFAYHVVKPVEPDELVKVILSVL